MTESRKKFATQVDVELLHDLRLLASEEGRQVQTLVEEAIGDLIEKHRNLKARPHVMSAYRTSHARFSTLYKKLAE